MKSLIIFLIFSTHAFSKTFEEEAQLLSGLLKNSLLKNLQNHIKEVGPIESIVYCKENVKTIASEAAAELKKNYEFGRISHKVRNENNKSPSWAENYLNEFKGTSKGDIKKEFIIYQFQDGKKAYLEPLYVQAQCLTCHGENISHEINNQLKKLYPNDQATGFKLNQFRGFLWIKQR